MRYFVLCTALLLTAVGGCRPAKPAARGEYRTVALDPQRDTDTAKRHNAAGVLLLKADKLDAAATELKAALSADTFFGPAHNNLGTVYYGQKKFYLAAWEFQYAAKLMPNRAEPRNNLGAVFEAVGKLDDAAKWYEAALQLEPDTPEVISNLARVYVRSNRDEARTRELLQDVMLKDQRPRWTRWARDHLTKMGGRVLPTTQPAESE
jgi:Flp pilus assembly protein TadD